MKSSRQQLLPLPPVPRALRILAGLDESAILALAEDVRGPRGFELSTRSEELAKKLGLTAPSDASALLSSLEFLYDRTHDFSGEGNNSDHETTLREFLHTSGLWSFLGDEQERSFKILADLLRENPHVEEKRKKTWLETGILNNASSFASFVDLRPHFSKDRSVISELLPIVIFQIGATSDIGGENAFVFQTDEAGVQQLKKAVDDAILKLNAVRKQEALSSLLAQRNENS